MASRQTRTAKAPQIVERVRVIGEETEGHRMWKHVLIGTDGICKLLEEYFEHGVPGPEPDDLEYLRDIHARYGLLIEKIVK